ncbi:hypothetical protein CXF83_05400 [Shewanella sp. Choline-02u-19]|jgi:hypothetical protein|uniref:hypothetical protein n=1 Tax=unclassified Shewanella TaxID=196818 RepID=UPI000C33621C|nr:MULTISPECIES: hypothetical protein [unclassified Shewanella]PKH56284.1 hypothetical protein CXF84_14070 [Shewanella sp. Bg11-22]PKI30078.1 hypothetical protein CXF83_05400 [Shewanella sp. Choline-02u-19]
MKILYFTCLLLLTSCGSIYTGNPVFDAVYSGTSAVIASDGASSKCEQGHAQDRVDCRKRKQEQVDAINKSIKEHSRK